jgi:nicotinamide mononucleotide (NMN) deamidase PncC
MNDIDELVSQVHGVPRKVVLAVSGGGAMAAAWLLAVPGASRTVLEVQVPYATEAMADWLGGAPGSYCSAETAREMARRARERGAWLAPGEEVVGIGATASLRSDRPKKGDHRVYLAAAMAGGVVSLSLRLAKEQRDRASEEEVVSRLVLNLLAEAFDLSARLDVPLLPGEQVQREDSPAGGALAALFAGHIEAVCVEPEGRVRADAARPAALLAGSFNPLHEGHVGLSALAARRTGRPAAFEMSVVNADKPALGEAEVRRRLAAFAWKAPLWLTRAATFAEKARLFPGVVFVVGADTAARIVQPRFYDDSAQAMNEALTGIRGQGCRFLVAGRVDGQGQFVGLEQLAIPASCADLFDAVPTEEFRLDLSSTQLREGR